VDSVVDVPSPRPETLPSAAPSGVLALSVRDLSKSFGPKRALDHVSFAVPAGSVVGLLGPNGAGKSTAMRMIVGVVRPDTGTVNVFQESADRDPLALKRLIGYVPESPQLYEFLTGAEYLDFIADMYGMPRDGRRERIQQYLVGLELAGHEDAMISGYSQGMRQKVALIAALVHRPRLLILDEPLNGLDPRSAKVVKDLLRNLATRDGIGVLFSTHVLEIAEAICDRVLILDQGRLLAEGTIRELRERSGRAGSGLEEVFLTLTGTTDLQDVVSALSR
jgi:ABC-2 type transport system ATP-binding protein